MAATSKSRLRLQTAHTNRPYGGGWWPEAADASQQLVDLVGQWPPDRPTILSYAFLNEDWDRSESSVPAEHRTLTLILILSDRSSCRLLVVPAHTEAETAEELLAEASNPHTTWRRMDFASTFRLPGAAAAAALR